MNKNILAIGLSILLMITIITPMSFGYGVNLKSVDREGKTSTSNGGPMDSPWPMYGYDTHHTSNGPYDSINNTGYVKWRFECGNVLGSAVIDQNGTIYFGDTDKHLYAVYPNGTLKWKYPTGGLLAGPALAEDGTIYVGSSNDHLYALYPNGTLKWRFNAGVDISTSPVIGEDGTIYFGTWEVLWTKAKFMAVNPNGTKKWSYPVGYHILSNPVIGDDGTIYFGCHDRKLYALNQNGTLKWKREPGSVYLYELSIAKDGTIFISGDNHLYARNSNGTPKWERYFGNGISRGQCIGEDGTLYVVSHRLYGLYPSNGTTKYESDFKTRASYTPTMSNDGILYFCTGGYEYLYAVNPDFTERWRRKTNGDGCITAPVIDKDGTVYIGTHASKKNFHAYGAGGEVLADVNGPYYGLKDIPLDFAGHADYGYYPYSWHWDFGDGQTSDEQYPSHVYSGPGNYTVTLIVTDNSGNVSEDVTFAWIQETNTPPDAPNIDGPREGTPATYYEFNFSTIDIDGNQVWYYIDWDALPNYGWMGPYQSGKEIMVRYEWMIPGKYIIRCKAKDNYDAESDWSEHEIKIPRTRASSYQWFEWLERFPILERLLSWLM